MIVKSISDLNLAIVQQLHVLTKLDPDLIVGIPRSGTLVASIIATHLQKPMTDLESYLQGRAFYKSGKLINIAQPGLKILLVDDSINQGTQMREAFSSVQKSGFGHTITRFAVYQSNKTQSQDIDLALETCVNPRAFQWNLWKHVSLKRWAIDMDGVLCRDPIEKIENDRGPRLIEFYKTADAKFPLQGTVNYIITSRLEKHRAVTEQWLHEHGIKYNCLIMKPIDSDQSHEQYKTDVLKQLSDVELYIESSERQAKFIARHAGITVWCTDLQTTYYP